MSLQISRNASRKRNIVSIISALLLFAGLGLLVIYAYWYKTGEEIIALPAGISIDIGQQDEVIEVPVEKAQIASHTVPSDQPRYFSMPSLNIAKARILSVGVDAKTQEIGTPVNIFDVGWYSQSGLQGQTGKVIFLDGHNGGPNVDGIFKKLPSVPLGTAFTVERGDGLITSYKIIENYNIKINEFDQEKMANVLKPKDGKETAVIVSCTGKWIPAKQTYDERVVVRAIAE